MINNNLDIIINVHNDESIFYNSVLNEILNNENYKNKYFKYKFKYINIKYNNN